MENKVDGGDCVDAWCDWCGEVGGAGVIQEPVTQYVTSGKDFVAMKKWVATMIKDPRLDKIAVMADPHSDRSFFRV